MKTEKAGEMRTMGHSAHPLPSRDALRHNRNKEVRLLLVGVPVWGRVACSMSGPVFLEGAC